MSMDYFALLKRFEGRRICLTLHGPSSLVGVLRELHHDCVRLSCAALVNDLDLAMPGGPCGEEAPPGPFRETLVHLNQVVAVSCLDDIPTDLPPTLDEPLESGLEQPLLITPLQLRLGRHAAAWFDPDRRRELAGELNSVRRKLAADLGVMVPELDIDSEPNLADWAAVLLIRGVTAARWQIDLERLVALEGTGITKPLAGKPVPRGVFGSAGVWIRRVRREQAEVFGYRVLGPGEILAGQIAQVLRLRSADLFGRQELELVLDQARERFPALVAETVPEVASHAYLHKVLRGLLREGVPVSDFEAILEALAECRGHNLSPEEAVERVRPALAGLLCERLRDGDGVLHAVLLETELEARLERHLRTTNGTAKLELAATQLEYLWASFRTKLLELAELGRPEVVVTEPKLRGALRKALAARLPGCVVLAKTEITAETALAGIGEVPLGKLFEPPRSKPARADAAG